MITLSSWVVYTLLTHSESANTRFRIAATFTRRPKTLAIFFVYLVVKFKKQIQNLKNKFIKEEFSGKGFVSRFKGLGEMPPSQLKETTMDPATRTLLKVTVPKRDINEADQRRLVDELVNILMGKKPELRFKYIQENADLIDNYDI